MKVFIATDHAGFEMKEALVSYMRELGHEVEDLGAHTFNGDDDYPDFIWQAAHAVSRANRDDVRGVILGGSGQGEAIVANRFPNVRAALYYMKNEEILRLSREHNDANILSLGARFLSVEDAKDAVNIWLETKFSGEERHKRRIRKIDELRTDT